MTPTTDNVAGLVAELRGMPSSLNDACRKMDRAAALLESQAKALRDAENALQRQGIIDSGRISNAMAYTETREDELKGARDALKQAVIKSAKDAVKIFDLNDMVLRYMHRAETAEARLKEAEKDAERYRYLRERDLDTIDKGGVFAGMTPKNIILNLEDLDREVDAARAFLNAGEK